MSAAVQRVLACTIHREYTILAPAPQPRHTIELQGQAAFF